MANWQEYVDSRLKLAELAVERRQRIVRQLAEQLEEFCREAGARGMTEDQADRFAKDQITDWRALESEILQVERGNQRSRVSRWTLEAEDYLRCKRGRWSMLGNLIQDARFGVRQLWLNPGFTLVAILTLALGIGANTVMFGMIHTVLLRRLPFPRPDRLVLVWSAPKSDPDRRSVVSAPNFLDWQRQNSVFERMAAMESRSFNLADEVGAPTEVFGVRVSSSLFPLLGVPPLLGRTFTPDEDRFGNDRVVVLSYALWRQRYGADPGIVGKSIRIDGVNRTVVGVMPKQFLFYGLDHLLWVPVAFTEEDLAKRDWLSFTVLARMKPGTSLPVARAAMEALTARMEEYPENKGRTVSLQPMAEWKVSGYRLILYSLFGAVGFVLLIACANVSNLLLARAATRRHEIAIRSALGAGRGRLLAQLMTESLLLGSAGGALGVAVALLGNSILPRLYEFDLRFAPFRDLEFRGLDLSPLLFTGGLALLATVLFGLAPAFGASRAQVGETLKAGLGRGSSPERGRARRLLVVAEVALALVVLTGAGLMMRSLARLWAVAPGFDPSKVLVVRASLPQKDPYGAAVRSNFCRQVEEGIGAIPGVTSVATVSHLPVTGGPTSRGLTLEDRPFEEGRRYHTGARYRLICPGYFATLKIPLLRGREFTLADTAASPGVAIVTEHMAAKSWPSEDPVGKRFKQGAFDSTAPWITVVGVVADIRDFGLDQPYQPVIYRPYTQSAWPVQYLLVRTAGDPSSFVEPVREAMSRIDPQQPLSGIRTMEDVISETVGYRQLVFSLLGLFAAMAVTLAAVGIFGVMTHAVASRRREIGIRMALGADRRHILRLALGDGLQQASIGVAIGVGGAIALTRLLRSLLFEVTPEDPLALAGAVLLLILVAFLASYVPTRRATRVDPVTALREE